MHAATHCFSIGLHWRLLSTRHEGLTGGGGVCGEYFHLLLYSVTLDVGVKSGELQTPPALPSGKEPHLSIAEHLDGPQSRCGRCVEEKHLCTFLEPNPNYQTVWFYFRYYID